MEIRHSLAPTDFSEAATETVTAAFELAQTFGAKLSLLHVIQVPVYAMEVALPLADLEQDARRELARLLPSSSQVVEENPDVRRTCRRGALGRLWVRQDARRCHREGYWR
jgi:nucleotide-binding universal stress UspA family protein